MIFQRVLKGIPAVTRKDLGMTEAEARAIVAGEGLKSSWWRNVPQGFITAGEITEKLTESALEDHLVNYEGSRIPMRSSVGLSSL